MESRRKKILVVAIAILLLLLLLIVLWRKPWQSKTLPPATAEETVQESPVPSRQQEDEALPIFVDEQEQVSQAGLQSLSQTFVERYGSYSSESDFDNIRDVLPMMSASFAASSEAMIATAQTPAGYYGISTQVLRVAVESVDDAAGVASVHVSTQREEAIGSAQAAQVKYQTIDLSFVKENGAWKVDSAIWGS